MSWQFTVGLRVQGKTDRIGVDADDALVAALKVKADLRPASISLGMAIVPSCTLHKMHKLRKYRRPLSLKEALGESMHPSRKR